MENTLAPSILSRSITLLDFVLRMEMGMDTEHKPVNSHRVYLESDHPEQLGIYYSYPDEQYGLWVLLITGHEHVTVFVERYGFRDVSDLEQITPEHLWERFLAGDAMLQFILDGSNVEFKLLEGGKTLMYVNDIYEEVLDVYLNSIEKATAFVKKNKKSLMLREKIYKN